MKRRKSCLIGVMLLHLYSNMVDPDWCIHLTLFGHEMQRLVKSESTRRKSTESRESCRYRKSTYHVTPLFGQNWNHTKRVIPWLVHFASYKSHTRSFSPLANELFSLSALYQEHGTTSGPPEQSERIAHQIHVGWGRTLYDDRLHLRLSFTRQISGALAKKKDSTKERENREEKSQEGQAGIPWR